MSHWDNPGQLVIGGNEYPTLINSAAQWPKTDCFEHWMMAMDAGQYMIDDILVKLIALPWRIVWKLGFLYLTTGLWS